MNRIRCDINNVITSVSKIGSLAVSTNDYLTASIMYNILSDLQYLLHEKDFDAIDFNKECTDEEC